MDAIVNNYNEKPLPLRAEDIGIDPAGIEILGEILVASGWLIVRIEMIAGRIDHPFRIMESLRQSATRQGLGGFRIEATLANHRLSKILGRRYHIQTLDASDPSRLRDFIEVAVAKETEP